ncbi:MAG TPA: elongation factor P [bacterium]|nr:elongation factor P [bacterium]
MEINDLKKGVVIKIDGQPFRVIEYQAVKPGKGTAFARTKLRSLLGDKVIDCTFKAGEKIEGADVSYQECQYLYSDGSAYHFMITDTYEQASLPADVVGDTARFLKENMEARLVFFEGNPVDLIIPAKMNFLVTEAEDAAKGDTATGAVKQVTIETGAKITVPLFVKQGDTIRVNTETGSYDVRV